MRSVSRLVAQQNRKFVRLRLRQLVTRRCLTMVSALHTLITQALTVSIGGSMSGRDILIVVLVAWAILAVVSLVGLNVPPPSGWLEAWTKWIAAVVGIVVSARVLWSGAGLLQKLPK